MVVIETENLTKVYRTTRKDPGLRGAVKANAYILGKPLEQSERLLDQLWAHASRPEFVWHNEWKVGDTLIWDNRCLIHRRDSFDAPQRRMMHRVQIRGEATC